MSDVSKLLRLLIRSFFGKKRAIRSENRWVNSQPWGNMTKRGEGERKWKFMNTICSKTRTKWSKMCLILHSCKCKYRGKNMISERGGENIIFNVKYWPLHFKEDDFHLSVYLYLLVYVVLLLLLLLYYYYGKNHRRNADFPNLISPKWLDVYSWFLDMFKPVESQWSV